MNTDSLEQIRMRARNLAVRIKDDEVLKEQLLKKPEETLAAAGISEDLAAEFLQASGIGADVTGYIGDIKHACVLSLLL